MPKKRRRPNKGLFTTFCCARCILGFGAPTERVHSHFFPNSLGGKRPGLFAQKPEILSHLAKAVPLQCHCWDGAVGHYSLTAGMALLDTTVSLLGWHCWTLQCHCWDGAVGHYSLTAGMALLDTTVSLLGWCCWTLQCHCWDGAVGH